jgi:hypothetical protein
MQFSSSLTSQPSSNFESQFTSANMGIKPKRKETQAFDPGVEREGNQRRFFVSLTVKNIVVDYGASFKIESRLPFSRSSENPSH